MNATMPALYLRIPRMGDAAVWKTIVLACFAIIGALLLRVLSQIDTTTQIAFDVRQAIVGLTVRMDSAEHEINRIRDVVGRVRLLPSKDSP
jgi:hypothetical protein